jgi:glycosyltransferase involved in cell wall biosynthesis
MKLICLDSTAVVETGPGSPAYFSRYLIEHLRTQGHDVTVADRFDARLCAEADAVWTEWANDEAFEAAASGVCKKLIVRLRGFEAFGPLDQLEWSNVDALVYESPFLKQLVEEKLPGLRGFRSHVIPSGIDVANIPFKERKAGPVVAMVGRGVADKGFQLAFEWARQRSDVQLHVGIALPEPRLLRYLEHSKPSNVTIHHRVETVKWLDEIDANYLLSASSWESLGYTIAEAMALGIKPLIHDTPGAELNWGKAFRWRSLSDLDVYVQKEYGVHNLDAISDTLDIGNAVSYASEVYRHFVEEHLDAYVQSRKFTGLLLAPATRTPAPPQQAAHLINHVEAALQAKRLDIADQALLEFRDRAPRLKGLDDHRAGLALKLASAYADVGDLDRGRVWALRSLGDVVRADTLGLLAEIAAAEGDLENAERWYDMRTATRDAATRYPSIDLADKEVGQRRLDIAHQLRPSLSGGGSSVQRFLIVVAVRNAEKYIGACLESIKVQPQRFKCVVSDDASTDGTFATVCEAVGTTTLDTRFLVTGTEKRVGSLHNIVLAIQENGRPGDVVVIVDGDDKLDPHALSVIEDAYNRGAWMTYGNFKTSAGRPSWMPPYPHRVVKANAFRSYPWSVSHPKTFRKELFDKIQIEDFQHEGKWFETAGDVALMLPMLEMAAERAVYIPAPIYEYTEDNPLADHRVDPEGQVRARNSILAKKPYERLEEL